MQPAGFIMPASDQDNESQQKGGEKGEEEGEPVNKEVIIHFLPRAFLTADFTSCGSNGLTM